MVRPQGKKMLSSSLRFLFYRLFYSPLPPAGEGVGEAEAEGGPLVSGPLASGMMLDDFPSPQSSPPRGEEVIKNIFSSLATMVAAEGGPLASGHDVR